MPTKIKLLPENVANQIAAGEVVDRPASVVKELVENSLDAGASRLLVEIEQGGRRSIRVLDDGSGMSREDALLCLERHATSKVRDTGDLFRISSLGFRGEALPSISSVSIMTLVTREAEADAGTRVEMKGGVVQNVIDTGAPKGSDIRVDRLFFNVPARRKFLKSVNTEFGHITHLVSNMALARPDVHFTLRHNGKDVYDLPASADLSGRLRHALGADALRHLVKVGRAYPNVVAGGELRVHGYVSQPSYTRSSTRALHLFVNRRFVRDKLINHAVFEAYRGLMPRGKYPLVVVFVDLPPESVDVNVHPAKHEIRFQEQGQVHDAILEAITGALRGSDRMGMVVSGPGRGARKDRAGAQARPEQDGGPRPEDPDLAEGARRAMERYFDRQQYRRDGGGDYPRPGHGPTTRGGPAGPPEAQRKTPPPGAPGPGAEADRDDQGEGRSAGPATAGGGSLPGLEFSRLRVIGQLAGTYILAEDQESLIVIDQHAAHERVVFERLREEWKRNDAAVQPLLFPVTVELSRSEAERAGRHQEDLARMGIETEPFGGGTVAVKSMPAILAGADPERVLLEIVDTLADTGGSDGLAGRLDDVFAVMACHCVVRAHKHMTEEEIRELLKAMDRAEFAGHCPHGRDVIVRVPVKDLEKWFGR